MHRHASMPDRRLPAARTDGSKRRDATVHLGAATPLSGYDFPVRPHTSSRTSNGRSNATLTYLNIDHNVRAYESYLSAERLASSFPLPIRPNQAFPVNQCGVTVHGHFDRYRPPGVGVAPISSPVTRFPCTAITHADVENQRRTFPQPAQFLTSAVARRHYPA